MINTQSTLVRLLKYLTLAMLSILSLASTDIYLPVMPHIASALHVRVAWVQFSISVYILVLGLAQIPYGVLADRFRFHCIFPIFVILFIVGSWLCASSSTLVNFLLGRVLQGIGAAAPLVSWQPLVLRLFDKQASKSVMYVLFMLICLSPGMAPIAGAFLTAHLGWSGCFYFLVGYAGVMLACVAILLKYSTLSQSLKKSVGESVIASFRALFKHKLFLNYLLIIACCYSGYLTYLIAYPVIVAATGVGSVSLAKQFIPLAVSFCFGALLGKRFMKDNEFNSFYAGVFIYGVSVILLLLGYLFSSRQPVLELLVPFMMLMFGNGMLLPVASYLAISSVSYRANSAAGLLGSSRMVVAFLASTLLSMGPESDLLYRLIFLLILSCLVVGCCVCYTLFIRKKTRLCSNK